ncbi:DUF6746 family protein [uncultured Marinobacter sp.]|uniref:DUF6746 family protein n=1 Tax=uncultured Marinobacter sp. TaxID=187379 RepID=UPI0030DCCA13|tara:strand:+ start:378 stop:746 length:369 start_codon:yes stop_codon:yes gene_type:complete
MKRSLIAMATVATLFSSAMVHAERPDHYKGLPANTLDEAVANFSEYNDKLAEVLQGELTPEAMNEVHQLTYTLENALGKVSEEFELLAETLEEVHIASESNDPQTVKKQGEAYLEVSRKVVR